MATNRLVLRSAASPYIFPLPDIVKGSVLAWDEVDNNFIFLKGLDIRSGSVSGSDLVLDRINGSNVTIDLSAFSGGSGTNYYTTGLTFNSGTYDLTVSLNNGSAFTQSLGILSGDMTITGGTYNPSNGVGTFTNNSGGTFDVTGFLTGYTDTDKFVTGGTYNSSAATITFTNNSGGTFTVTDISGGTSSGVYSQTDNYTSGVTQTINHSAGTTDVLVQIINTSTNELVSGDIDNYQTNSLDVTLSQTLSNIKVVVVGGASGGGGTLAWPYGTTGLFAQTGDSATVSATTTPTTIIGSGVGELKFPANALQVGDTFHLKCGGLVKSIGFSGLTFNLSGATELLDTGIIGNNGTSGTSIDRPWELEIDLTIRSTGASGTVIVVGEFNWAGYLISGGSGVSINRWNFHQSSSIDTTVNNALDLTVELGDLTSAIYSQLTYLNKVY